MFINIPASGSPSWKEAVTNPSDLPSQGNTNADIRLVLNTNELYRWDSTLSSWTLISGGGGGGSTYVVQKFTLSGLDISNKFVTLSGTPTFPAMTELHVIGGPLQDSGPDYVVSGNTVDWSGKTLDGVLVISDVLYVAYI